MIRPIKPHSGPNSTNSSALGHRPATGALASTPPTANQGVTTHGLESLKAKEEAKIDSLSGPESLKRRLMEIGFVPGSAVRFEMATPFGDPLVFSLRGSTIALRRKEAQCVRIVR
jgi:ferrous iron transport protein A